MKHSWLKTIPLPAALMAGLVIGLTGKFLGAPVGEPLNDTNAWLNQNTASPGVALFFAGCLIAWLVHQALELLVKGRQRNARLRLADLRDEGVGLRIEGLHSIQTDDETTNWVERITDWDQRVVAAIAVIDLPDARQHATLDYPGEPRAHATRYHNDYHRHFFILHDVRLARLNERMTQYSVQFGNAA